HAMSCGDLIVTTWLLGSTCTPVHAFGREFAAGLSNLVSIIQPEGIRTGTVTIARATARSSQYTSYAIALETRRFTSCTDCIAGPLLLPSHSLLFSFARKVQGKCILVERFCE